MDTREYSILLDIQDNNGPSALTLLPDDHPYYVDLNTRTIEKNNMFREDNEEEKYNICKNIAIEIDCLDYTINNEFFQVDDLYD